MGLVLYPKAVYQWRRRTISAHRTDLEGDATEDGVARSLVDRPAGPALAGMAAPHERHVRDNELHALLVNAQVALARFSVDDGGVAGRGLPEDP
jgi:hypothetical protein